MIFRKPLFVLCRNQKGSSKGPIDEDAACTCVGIVTSDTDGRNSLPTGKMIALHTLDCVLDKKLLDGSGS